MRDRKKHKALEEKYEHYVCKFCMEIGAKEVIDEFLEDLDNLPTEHVTWVKEHEIRKAKFGEFGTIQSSMIFLPEITRLKHKWEAKKNED